MAQKRKTISKKIRFEVFKRDNFTCQYCGRMAPDVVLEVDHINPVSKGGDNDISNYDLNTAIMLLKKCHELGATTDSLKEFTINCNNWTQWKNGLNKFIEENKDNKSVSFPRWKWWLLKQLIIIAIC
mgnify:CR=1 FL=1